MEKNIQYISKLTKEFEIHSLADISTFAHITMICCFKSELYEILDTIQPHVTESNIFPYYTSGIFYVLL